MKKKSRYDFSNWMSLSISSTNKADPKFNSLGWSPVLRSTILTSLEASETLWYVELRSKSRESSFESWCLDSSSISNTCDVGE